MTTEEKYIIMLAMALKFKHRSMLTIALVNIAKQTLIT